MDLAVSTTLNQIYSIQENNWNISREMGEILSDLVQSHEPQNILEIGTSTGASGIWMAQAAQSYGGIITTIESNKIRHSEATRHFESTGLPNIVPLYAHAPEVFDSLSKTPIDFLFLDCIKYYYLDFFRLLVPRFSKGCVIVADNVVSHSSQLAQYLEFVRSLKDFESMCISKDSGFEVTIKRN